MFPAIRRMIAMPFIERSRKKKLWKDIRTPEEIMKEMKHFNDISLECDRKGNKVLAKEYKTMADTLQWVLQIGCDGTSK